MKYFIFILITIALISCDASGSDERKSEKSVTTTRDASGEITAKYINEYDAETRTQRNLETDKKGKMKSHHFAKFNENGDAIETIWYKDKTDIEYRTVNFYNENGLYSGGILYNEFNVVIEKDEVLYRKGKNTRTGVYTGNGRLKYTVYEEHDREKRIKKIKHISPEGKVLTRRTRKYDEDKTVIFTSYSLSNGQCGSRKIQRDSHGDIKKAEMFRNGKLESRIVVDAQYDAKGRVVKQMYVQNCQPPVYVTCFYRDSNERNSTRESRNKEGKLISISETVFYNNLLKAIKVNYCLIGIF